MKFCDFSFRPRLCVAAPPREKFRLNRLFMPVVHQAQGAVLGQGGAERPGHAQGLGGGAELDILHQQQFKSGIPAGLPEDARVAHKTGEISTVAHDAGIVYLDGRDAYVVVILTEWAADVSGHRQETIARISRAVYEFMTGAQP